MDMPTIITIETSITASIDDVWDAFNEPRHILKWDKSDDWHITQVTNDLRIGGQLILNMEEKNSANRFDVTATYTQLEPKSLIEFLMDDGQIRNRMVRMNFLITDIGVMVRQTFDTDLSLSIKEQRLDWQEVQHRFARYVESMAHFQ